jgi:hypothetical protein
MLDYLKRIRNLLNFLRVRLKRRFIFMGMLNAVFAPFIVLYLLMYSFFRYFEVCVFSAFRSLYESSNALVRNITKIPRR